MKKFCKSVLYNVQIVLKMTLEKHLFDFEQSSQSHPMSRHHSKCCQTAKIKPIERYL
jgi:hypothetical protein